MYAYQPHTTTKTKRQAVAALGLTQAVALAVGLGLGRLLLDKEAASYYQVNFGRWLDVSQVFVGAWACVLGGVVFIRRHRH